MTKEEFILSGLLELYATGAASEEERETVEDFLSRYPDLRAELASIEDALEKYSFANGSSARPALKARVMDEIFGTEAQKSVDTPVIPIRRGGMRLYKMIAAAVFILLIASIVLNYSYYKRYHSAKADLDLALEKIQQQSKENKAMTNDLGIVSNRYAVPVVLKGTEKAPDAVAKIFWLKNTGQVYVDASNLPAVPEGKQYQLWAIVDGKPVDAGMIQTSSGTFRIQKMKSFGKADAFAITLEKAGGSPTPTMDQMVVISKL